MIRLKFIILALIFVVTGCLNEDDPQEPASFNKADFSLIAEGDAVPADGQTSREIKLTLVSNAADLLDRMTIFKATGGTFSNGKSIDTVTLSGTTVSAYLKHSTAEAVEIEASLGGTTESTQVTFNPFSQSAEFSLAASTDDVAADGVSQAIVTLTYTQLSNASGASQMVTFTTNAGKFPNNSTTVEVPLNTAQSNALAYLTHDAAEPVMVTAQLQGKTGMQQVVFVNAEPEIVLVNPSSATITNAGGQRVTLEAKLLRDKGVPTAGQSIIWSATPNGGVNPGILLNQTRSGATGLATVEYVMQDTTFTGDITFLAEFITAENDTIRGSNRVHVEDSN